MNRRKKTPPVPWSAIDTGRIAAPPAADAGHLHVSSEFGRQIAVDFETDTGFHQSGGRPSHLDSSCWAAWTVTPALQGAPPDKVQSNYFCQSIRTSYTEADLPPASLFRGTRALLPRGDFDSRSRVGAEIGHERIKLLRFVEPWPKRGIGLARRPTSPRETDFHAPGRVIVSALDVERKPGRASRAVRTSSAPRSRPHRERHAARPYSAATAAPRSSILRPRRLATPAPY